MSEKNSKRQGQHKREASTGDGEPAAGRDNSTPAVAGNDNGTNLPIKRSKAKKKPIWTSNIPTTKYVYARQYTSFRENAKKFAAILGDSLRGTKQGYEELRRYGSEGLVQSRGIGFL
jgi:hypothetical protein